MFFFYWIINYASKCLQIAEQASIKQQTLSQWINKDRFPDVISVIKIAKILNISVDYFIFGEQDKNLPAETQSIVNILNSLSNEEFKIVSIMINALAKKERKETKKYNDKK